jgi:hypothetical protein
VAYALQTERRIKSKSRSRKRIRRKSRIKINDRAATVGPEAA